MHLPVTTKDSAYVGSRALYQLSLRNALLLLILIGSDGFCASLCRLKIWVLLLFLI